MIINKFSREEAVLGIRSAKKRYPTVVLENPFIRSCADEVLKNTKGISSELEAAIKQFLLDKRNYFMSEYQKLAVKTALSKMFNERKKIN